MGLISHGCSLSIAIQKIIVDSDDIAMLIFLFQSPVCSPAFYLAKHLGIYVNV